VWPVLTSHGAPLHTTDPGSLAAPPSGTGMGGVPVDPSAPPSPIGVVLPSPTGVTLPSVPGVTVLVPPELLLPLLLPLLLADPLLLPEPGLPASNVVFESSPPQWASAIGATAATGTSQASKVASFVIVHLPTGGIYFVRDGLVRAKQYPLRSKCRPTCMRALFDSVAARQSLPASLAALPESLAGVPAVAPPGSNSAQSAAPSANDCPAVHLLAYGSQ
jgi:hypothetical protein